MSVQVGNVNDGIHSTAAADTTVPRETGRSTGPIELSVVIVTYNEADRIRACIESVISSCRDLVDFEVILVDSNSTDGTVDIATEYPITVARIADDELTTPGAGRYVGTKIARGERVLFVDGDMVIHAEWLGRALDVLDAQPTVAAVDGHINTPSDIETTTQVKAVRGVALYRAEALDAVGGFDPYLQSLEDIHLGFELSAAGYELRRLPEVAADHPPRTASASEILRRWGRGYTFGTGQALRRSAGSKQLLAKHLSRIRYRLALLAWLCAGVISILFPLILLSWLGFSALAMVLLTVQLGVRDAVRILLAKAVGVVGLVRGLFDPPAPPESFPLAAVEIVKRGTVYTTDGM